MILQQKLKEKGWYLTEEGIKKLITIDNLQTENINDIISLALNWDFRDIAAGALPTKPDSNGTIPGHIVLQLQKMRNISAPKSNEESTAAPRFLQIELTDGANTVTALEFERIAFLNLNVPPGTKFFLKCEKLILLNGFLVLKASDIEILGGKVETLIEKWELARQMLKYARSTQRISGSGGPPPWIAFGKRLDARKDVFHSDRNFKSLQTLNEKDKCSKENDEFNASRSNAIAEAAKTGQKKVFGGGQQHILDHNVKKILDKGYTEEEAKQALKTTNNNLERALYNLKRRNNKNVSAENSTKPVYPTTGVRIKDRGNITLSKDESSLSKPQTNVSLFDFLTDKLPATTLHTNNLETEAIIANTSSDRKLKDTNSVKTYNIKASNALGNKFENNMSSSFAANRATAPTSEDRRSHNFNRKQEDHNQQYSKRVTKCEERNQLNKAKPPTQNYSKIQNPVSPPREGNDIATYNKSTKRNERQPKREKEQTRLQSISDNQTNNKRPNDCKKITENKCFKPKDINRSNHDTKGNAGNYQQNSNNFDTNLDKLADNISKLPIENKKDLSSKVQMEKDKNHQYNVGVTKTKKSSVSQLQNSENHSKNSLHANSTHYKDQENRFSKSFQQNTKSDAYSPQLENGFAYDSSKIMGFQSKEANEYAINMLKSQGMTTQHIQQQQNPQSQPTAPGLQPTTLKHPHSQIVNSQAAANMGYITQNPNVFVPTPHQVPAQINIISGQNWSWREGDLCLAKYWDDGNYYKAKITAISEKTCVVLFVGYGNHEEVLKSDCVPITDSQHVHLNTYQNNINAPPISQPSPPAFQQKSNLISGANGIGNQRLRSDRQMYVPPPKRNNN